MQHAKHTIKKGVLFGMVSAVLVSSAADNDQSSDRVFQQIERQIIQESRVVEFLNEAAAGAAPSATDERLACMQTKVSYRVKNPTSSLSWAKVLSYIPKFPAPKVAELLNRADFVGSTREDVVRALAANLVDRNTSVLSLIHQKEIRQLLTEEREKKDVLKSRSAVLSELFASQLLRFNVLCHEEYVTSHSHETGLVVFYKVAGKSDLLLDLNKKKMKPFERPSGDFVTKDWIVKVCQNMFTYQSKKDLCVREIAICWKTHPDLFCSPVRLINDCTFMMRHFDEVAVIKLDKDGTAPRVKMVDVDHSYRYDIVGDKLLFFSCEDAQQKKPILVINTTDMIDYEPKADFSLMLELGYKTPYVEKSVLFERSIKPISNGLFEVSVIDKEVSIKDQSSKAVLQTYKAPFKVKSICLTRDHILSIEVFGNHGADNGECVSILMLNRSFEDAESWKKYQEEHPWLYTLLRTVLRR